MTHKEFNEQMTALLDEIDTKAETIPCPISAYIVESALLGRKSKEVSMRLITKRPDLAERLLKLHKWHLENEGTK